MSMNKNVCHSYIGPRSGRNSLNSVRMDVIFQYHNIQRMLRQFDVIQRVEIGVISNLLKGALVTIFCITYELYEVFHG